MSEKLLTFFALVILGLFSGCGGEGVVKSTSDESATSAVGISMYDEGSQDQGMGESEAGRSQTNVNAQTESTQQIRTEIPELPENIIHSDEQYTPAPGYARVNPENQKDSGIKKKDSEEYWKIDTSTDIYIDRNLIIGNEISHETKSIYSVLIQDASISVRAGENAQGFYVKELKKINLRLTPPEFKDAFEKHIVAWERDSTDEINSTMDEILRIALKYGVRMK
jgi:hypothetical protein